MNKERGIEIDRYRTLQILDELSSNDSLTQRELSKRLGIALGLINSYIKNLIKKGFITVKNIPPKRYVYYLTPKGFAEKTRLAYTLLQDYTRIYREAKKNLRELFRRIQSEGVKKIVFAGSDEVAEIAYITLQETELELVAVVDDGRIGEDFFSYKIGSIKDLIDLNFDIVLIASYLKCDVIKEQLLRQGIKKKKLKVIFSNEDF